MNRLSAQDRTTTDAINRLLLEIAESAGKIRTTNNTLKDVAEQNDEWRWAQDDIKELREKQAKARKVLEADKDYQLVSAELQEQKYKHKDLQEILSHHLIEHFRETGDTTFETMEGDTIQIIISAKPGKETAE